MNENIDLCEILKDCPKGWKFWSPIFGEVKFEHNYKKVSLNNQFSITGVDIKSSGLSVSYSGKPVKYDRYSTGKFFLK